MPRMGIERCVSCFYKAETKSGDPEAVNLLNRQFAAEKPGEVLVTGITMFTIGVSKLYFSPLIDVFNNQVLSWRLSSTLKEHGAIRSISRSMLRQRARGIILLTREDRARSG